MARYVGYRSLILLFHFAIFAISSKHKYVITVDFDSSLTQIIPHFWRSTGFCPPDPHEEAYKYFLSQDMKLNLAFIGGLPHDAIVQVRTHWLLDLLRINRDIDFKYLDEYLDMLKENGLKPGFEIMGNPSKVFHDFENSSDVYLLQEIVEKIASRYRDRFGMEYVQNWNWESWNEPDNGDFDNVTMTSQGLMNYYDACSTALKSVSTNFKIGAPAQKLVKERSPKAWALLQHCYNGTNFITKQNGIALDYISVHYKGGGNSLPILQGEANIVNEIHSRWNNFSLLPVYNDEADPMVRWSDPYTWRADNTYAAIIVKVIAQHWFQKVYNPNSSFSSAFSLLSNDDAFLSYHPWIFEQRTLLARFQINNTSPPYVLLVRKPAYIVFGLLSYLDEEALYATIQDKDGHKVSVNTSDVGMLATVIRQNENITRITLLIYNSNDTSNKSDVASVKIKLDGVNLHPDAEFRFMVFTMDNEVSNPYTIWKNLSSPYFPTFHQIEQIIKKEEPVSRGPFVLNVSQVNFRVKIQMPGIKLIHICSKMNYLPGPVGEVSIYNVTNNLIMIAWNDSNVNTKCIKTYEIEMLRQNGKYKRINRRDTIFNTFVFNPMGRKKWYSSHQHNLRPNKFYASDHLVTGSYRIRAVDYWLRFGPYSAPVLYPKR